MKANFSSTSTSGSTDEIELQMNSPRHVIKRAKNPPFFKIVFAKRGTPLIEPHRVIEKKE